MSENNVQAGRLISSHPYTDLTSGRWLKGLLHLHNGDSNSGRAVRKVDHINGYYELGYKFLMFTEFNTYINESSLENYRISAEHFFSNSFSDLMLLPGIELMDYATENPKPHMVVGAVDDEQSIRSILNYYREKEYQKIIDTVNELHGFVVIVHPNHPVYNVSYTELKALNGFLGVEVLSAGEVARQEPAFNVKHQPNNPKWDQLLRSGRHVYCFASDDAFNESHRGEYWIVAYVTSKSTKLLSYRDVVDSIKSGSFYIRSCDRNADEAKLPLFGISNIAVSGSRITFDTNGVGKCFALEDGITFHQVNQHSSDQYLYDVAPLSKSANYVRFEFHSTEGRRRAWTQPFFL